MIHSPSSIIKNGIVTLDKTQFSYKSRMFLIDKRPINIMFVLLIKLLAVYFRKKSLMLQKYS